ncbi:MAG: DUF2189 domain-containing protein [Aurantimonas endophytica]|uniref:DUF2189 domain-containing protein n=1 Tax=Aurantimonas endophytica TaxID=1522175 RepID=UPI003002D4EF
MTEAHENYGLLTQTSDIREMQNPELQRHLPPSAALDWLKAGWRDLIAHPRISLAYGFAVFLLSLLTVWSMFSFGWDHILFPAVSGFLIVGPFVAIGLYDISRRRDAGEPVSLGRLYRVRARSGTQVFFVGILLCLLMLIWWRAAVIVYALFFGYRPFPGFDSLAPMLFTTGTGWAMLIVGAVVGGLFAAFSFAISAFSMPMLLNERSDALTAMGTSMVLVWNNLPVMMAWGAMALALFAISLLTGFLGLVVIFPLLGYGTWHAYKAIRRAEELPQVEEPPSQLARV